MRAFWLTGQRHEIGTRLEVTDSVARELVASGKACKSPQETQAAPAAQPGPMTTETAAAVVKGKAAAKDSAS